MFIDIPLAILYAADERLRGDNRGFGGFGEMILGGCIIYYLLTHSIDWYILPFSVLWSLGSTWGWGEPMGTAIHRRPGMMAHKLEWWQFWLFKRDVYAALTLRGAMWGLPCLLMSCVTPDAWKAALAITIAFPLSCYITSFTKEEWFHWSWLDKKWHFCEWVRGLMTAGLIVVM